MRYHRPYWYELLAIEVKYSICRIFQYWLERIKFSRLIIDHLYDEFELVNRQYNPFIALVIFKRMQVLTEWGLLSKAFFPYEQALAEPVIISRRDYEYDLFNPW